MVDIRTVGAGYFGKSFTKFTIADDQNGTLLGKASNDTFIGGGAGSGDKGDFITIIRPDNRAQHPGGLAQDIGKFDLPMANIRGHHSAFYGIR